MIARSLVLLLVAIVANAAQAKVIEFRIWADGQAKSSSLLFIQGKQAKYCRVAAGGAEKSTCDLEQGAFAPTTTDKNFLFWTNGRNDNDTIELESFMIPGGDEFQLFLQERRGDHATATDFTGTATLSSGTLYQVTYRHDELSDSLYAMIEKECNPCVYGFTKPGILTESMHMCRRRTLRGKSRKVKSCL